MQFNEKKVLKSYDLAKARYADLDVDTDNVLSILSNISISLNCWQGDDVTGFEGSGQAPGGGLQVTGSYPGKARNGDELRQDLEKAFSLIPGKHRLNLHASYAETKGKRVDRDQLEAQHFETWIHWAKALSIGLDFNPTCFSHKMADTGFTLSSPEKEIQTFWIRHCMACRKIGEHMGQELGNPCITNIWIPDGYKDIPVDRKTPRERLKHALDAIFSENMDTRYNRDAVESKLFGIGSESYVVGSHEFYLGYAIRNNKLLCLDTGHFHPTEVVSDKISAVLTHLDEILLHVSRGIRWDSDHVVILSDELNAIAHEIVQGDFIDRVHIGLDFFDASINRIAAWVIGTRSVIKALLIALLEPSDVLRQMEEEGDHTARLAMLEECKTLPFGAVWDHYLMTQSVLWGDWWLKDIKEYEDKVLSIR